MLINDTMWSSNLFFFFASYYFPRFSWVRFFRVQVFLGPTPGSWSRVWIQVLEVNDVKQLYWNHTSAWVLSILLFSLFIIWHICFFFRIVLTEKYRIIKALEHDFYHKVIERKCSGNVRLKTGYTFVEKRVWRFSVNKNYCI